MLAPLAVLAALIGGLLFRRRRRTGLLPAHAVIVSPRQSTVISRDGGVRSVQEAKLTLQADDLERLWTPANLENLARTYWLFLSRVTLKLIRVIYTEDSRSVVLIARPLTLLRFDTPDYTMEGDCGAVRWKIRDGLLVARTGRGGAGYLELKVRRELPREDGMVDLHITVEVANFYPSIAAGFSRPVYEMTQSFVHVLVTHAFLRSLAKLDLAPSIIGQFAEAVVDAVTGGDDQP